MERELIESIPSGLVACRVDGRELHITKLSPTSLYVRAISLSDSAHHLEIAFYRPEDGLYRTMAVPDCRCRATARYAHWSEYRFDLTVLPDCAHEVRRIAREYARYVTLRMQDDGTACSCELAGYPGHLDDDFCADWTEQKRLWFSDIARRPFSDDFELAVSLHDAALQRLYLREEIDGFMAKYAACSFLSGHDLLRRIPQRLYIGSQFCPMQCPDADTLTQLANRARADNLCITLALPYLQNGDIPAVETLLDTAEAHCAAHNTRMEVTVNDWGLLPLLKHRHRPRLDPVLGVLLNKRRKDPRSAYKTGAERFRGETSLNDPDFRRFLAGNGIRRFEFEACNAPVCIPEGAHSLHLPYYQTNTSQLCPLRALRLNGDRGAQSPASSCPGYCLENVQLYPKHLRMAGRYTSLFGLDDGPLRSPDALRQWLRQGIDRIVLNL